MIRFPVLILVFALAACGPGGGAETPSELDAVDVPPAAVLDAAALGGWLPAEVAGLDRAGLVDSTDAALGAEVTRAVASYGAADVRLAVADLGSADMAEMMGYGWGLGGRASESVGGHPAQASGGGAGRPHTYRALVAGRFLVEAVSADAALARTAVAAVDLDALARAGR